MAGLLRNILNRTPGDNENIVVIERRYQRIVKTDVMLRNS
jgi:hypothetical protein